MRILSEFSVGGVTDGSTGYADATSDEIQRICCYICGISG